MLYDRTSSKRMRALVRELVREAVKIDQAWAAEIVDVLEGA